MPEAYRDTFGGTVVMDANDIGRDALEQVDPSTQRLPGVGGSEAPDWTDYEPALSREDLGLIEAGEVGEVVAELYDAVPRLWAPHVFSDVVRTALRPARHGDSSGVRGAAWLAADDLAGSG